MDELIRLSQSTHYRTRITQAFKFIPPASKASPVKNPEMAQSVGWAAVGKYSDLQVFRVWGAVFLRME